MSNAPASPAQLIAALSKLMHRFPQFADYLRTSRDAILGSVGDDGAHNVILAAIGRGACTYKELREITGLSYSYLYRHLAQLEKAGLITITQESARGNFRPRKLFFLVNREKR